LIARLVFPTDGEDSSKGAKHVDCRACETLANEFGNENGLNGAADENDADKVDWNELEEDDDESDCDVDVKVGDFIWADADDENLMSTGSSVATFAAVGISEFANDADVA
jgi:hypothetical protein